MVGTVGRLVYEKGYAELFQVAEQLRVQCDTIKFLVIGAEEHDQNDSVSHDLIADLAARKVVQFLGWSNEMPRWYSAMDAFVLPSYREGIPRACMEASAMQLPVIASDIRGCREVVENGTTGLLVPVRNVEALATAILKLFGDRRLAAEMGMNGQRRIRTQFDSKLVASRLREFYSNLDQMIGTGVSAA